jgi:MerR family redox-sensitive transcriptional activator SoxR
VRNTFHLGDGVAPRRFARDVVRRVAFIRVAQRVGLTLDDIRNALGTLPDRRTPTAADWARLSRAWKAQLDERIQLLEHVRDDLSSCIGCGCLSLHVPDLATREVAKRATRATRRPR